MARTKGYIQSNGRYYAVMNVNGKRVSLGGYDSPEEATQAYRRACEEIGRDPDRPPRGRPPKDASDETRVFSGMDLEHVWSTFETVEAKLTWLYRTVARLRAENKSLALRVEELED